MIATLIGTVVALLALLVWAFDRQRQIYEQLFQILERDRDEARHEAKVFRGLAFPVMLKIESREEAAQPGLSSQPLRQSTASGAASSGPSTPNPLFNKRTPFRIRFNQMRKLTNTPQQKTDALASALEKQSPEVTHANR